MLLFRIELYANPNFSLSLDARRSASRCVRPSLGLSASKRATMANKPKRIITNTLCQAYLWYIFLWVCVCVCVRADICVVKGQQNLNNEKSLLNFPQRAQPTLQPCKQSAVCLRIYVISTIFVVVVVGVSFFMSDFLFGMPSSFRRSSSAFTRKSKLQVVPLCVYVCLCIYIMYMCVCMFVCCKSIRVAISFACTQCPSIHGNQSATH